MGTKAEARFAFIQEKAEFAERGIAGRVSHAAHVIRKMQTAAERRRSSYWRAHEWALGRHNERRDVGLRGRITLSNLLFARVVTRAERMMARGNRPRAVQPGARNAITVIHRPRGGVCQLACAFRTDRPPPRRLARAGPRPRARISRARLARDRDRARQCRKARGARARGARDNLRIERVDIADTDGIAELRDTLGDEKLDLLFVVAGISGSVPKPLHEVSPDEAARVT